MDHAVITPEHDRNIITRGLPKTGQFTSYWNEDDGEHEAGWWWGRLNANNRTRFKTQTIAGDIIIYDRATGLTWPAVYGGGGIKTSGRWIPSMNWALGLNFAGYTDWRLPNIKELLSIIVYDRALYVAGLPLIYQPPWQNFVIAQEWWWTSTISVVNTGDMYRLNLVNGLSDTIMSDLYAATIPVRGAKPNSP